MIMKFIALLLFANCCLSMKLRDNPSISGYGFKEDYDVFENQDNSYDDYNYDNNYQSEEDDQYTSDDNTFEVYKRHNNQHYCHEKHELKQHSPGVYPRYTLEIKCVSGKGANSYQAKDCKPVKVRQYLLQETNGKLKEIGVEIEKGCRKYL